MSSIMLLFVMLSSIALQFTAVYSIGVCYGVIGNNLPSRQEVISLYKSNGIKQMRIYFPDEQALQALRGSNIEVLVDVAKETLPLVANNPSYATNWVKKFVVSYSDVKIKYISVGNEINPGDAEAKYILRGMQNIQKAISAANLQGKVKVSTAIKMDLFENTYPPRDGRFTGTASPFIKPIINFLINNGSPLLANVYTYFAYKDQNNIPLDYALFRQQGTNEVGYQNLFDAMLDSIYYALEKVGAQNLKVVVSESGWPSDGGEKGASVENARTYYRNLIGHVKGFKTPKHNGPIETYLFAMFDENDKGGLATEKHFGLFKPDKSSKYGISFN